MGIGKRIASAWDALFGYEAADGTGSHRRSQSTVTGKSEDTILTEQRRSTIISTVRDLQRNMTVAAWAIRRHLDYVSTFVFQARTGDKDTDAKIEDAVRTWSMPENFDACGLLNRQNFIRTMEACRTLDGDLLVVQEDDGLVRAIESDRIKTPPNDVSDYDSWVNGVRRDERGRIEAYGVWRRTQYTNLEYEREIDAEFCFPLFAYRSRFDQVRGISPLAPAINSFVDLHDSLTWALSKIKLAQLFGLVITRNSGAALGSITADTDNDEYSVNFKQGPVLLNMRPGDDAKFLESHSPSAEAQAFWTTMIPMCLKCLDIPYSYYDESHTNYSGARQAMLQYEQSAAVKREDVKAFLDRWISWRLASAIARREVPASWRGAKWEWIPTGLPWIDPLKESSANAVELSSGTTSRTRICKARGLDWQDILAELQNENQQLIDAGMVPDLPTMKIVVGDNNEEG